ncbi:lysoplasmalogenase [Microbulbifer thermotolerans]|uniref:lysoplasmalogenase n=1 Tax=Microbulbifer thermotolerans TaxID=252514 RepID=UPI00224922B7|nr:lysoplasmalogenase [Microbulbifer thermotolerans]MCX2832292.1 lysoplasmalogenase [Microbulbifer thermotolerans]
MTATPSNLSIRVPTHLPTTFIAAALTYLILDAAGLRGPWMALLKTLPIILLALIARHRLSGSTRGLTLAALALSALGDLLLALDFPGQFVYGLSAFLLAQLAYAFNFLRGADFRCRHSVLRGAPVLLAAFLLAQLLLPAAGELAPAVAVYFLAIVTMALGAAAHRGNSTLLFVGAVTFMASDTLIAIHKFVTPLPMAGTAIMVTYYSAQMALLYGIGRARA